MLSRYGRQTGEPDDDALWAMAAELHSNVPEDKRPQSWSDFSPEQIERLHRAANAFLAALSPPPQGDLPQTPTMHPIEKFWRELDLPEWFLGNGGSNTKLYALYDAIRAPLSAQTGEPDFDGWPIEALDEIERMRAAIERGEYAELPPLGDSRRRAKTPQPDTANEPVAWRYKCRDGSEVLMLKRLTDEQKQRGYYTGEDGEDLVDGDEAIVGPFHWAEETPLYASPPPQPDTAPVSGRIVGGAAPCPFCGAPAKLGDDPLKPVLYCDNDDCFGPHTTAGNLDDAIRQWNTRHQPDTAPSPLSAGEVEARLKPIMQEIVDLIDSGAQNGESIKITNGHLCRWYDGLELLAALSQPPATEQIRQENVREEIHRVLTYYFYTGEPGEHDAIETATDVLAALSAQTGEPVAWRWKWPRDRIWTVSLYDPGYASDASVIVQPLYAASPPQPDTAP